MSLGAVITLLNRLSDGAKDRKELFGFWSKSSVIDMALELRWVSVENDRVSITDRGRQALVNYDRAAAFKERM